MIEKFKVTVISTHEDEENVVVGLGQESSDGYLMLQRSLPIGSEDDFGVYVEFGEESNSACDAVVLCGIGRHRLVMELSEPVGVDGLIRGFDLELAISDQVFASLVKALRKVFCDAEGVLQVTDD